MRACAPSILVSLMRVRVKIDVSELSLRSVWFLANGSLVFLGSICDYLGSDCLKIGVLWVIFDFLVGLVL